MTPYDAAMIGVVIAGMIWGALRGITWQLAGIASLGLGYAVAFPLSGELAAHFPGEPVFARGLAMLAVYVAVSGGVYLVAWLIRATLRKLKFEAYDRHLGMILGGAEGAMLGVVATVFIVSLAPATREPILTSHAGHVVGGFLDAVQPALPGEIRTVLRPFWEDPTTSPDSGRLARLDAPADDFPRMLPADARWSTDRVPPAVPAPQRTELFPLSNDGTSVDPAVVRSWMELGVQRLRQQTSVDPVGPPQAPPARLPDPGTSYWWEGDGHGRTTRHR